MTCPICTLEIQALDGVTITRVVTHSKCDGRPAATNPETIATLVELVERMLEVGKIGNQSDAEWRASRAANITQVMVSDFIISERK